ncbi:MAG TPA: efflux RND transporter periplasmic adaptor subunit [Rhodanobacteraceae bacterium]|nr:efflux RND transporter periplasmic adaptor subunit [Rhodanobacteraceae bacterium]
MLRHLLSCIPPRMAARSVAAAGLLLAAASLGACSSGSTGSAEAKETPAVTAIPVEVAVVARQAVNASYSGTATLEAQGEADVVAKTSGILQKLLTEEGQHVEEGQLLARLDDASARNGLAQAQATLRKYQAKFDRAERAVKTHLIPKDEYDQDKFDLQTQRAVTEGAELELSYTRIVAPISGVIARRMVKPGNLVQANATVFHIVDMDPLLAVLNVPERDLNTLKPGQPVHMSADALPGRDFEGKVSRIAPVVDAASGTFRVTCEFSDTTHALRPGMFGRIEIRYDERLDALTIPRAALIDEDGEISVFVVAPASAKPIAAAGAADAKSTATKGAATAKESGAHVPATPMLLATRRVVKTGYADGDRIEIRHGLSNGDRVITVGRNAVRDGAVVQVLENRP